MEKCYWDKKLMQIGHLLVNKRAKLSKSTSLYPVWVECQNKRRYDDDICYDCVQTYIT